MEHERLAQLLESTLGRQLSWIAAADAKTGFIFAVATAMLGFLAAAAPRYGQWTSSGVVLAIVAAANLFVALASLVAAIFPRTAGPKLSVIFFGGIASRHVDKFRDDIHGLDLPMYLEDLIEQCHINAQIAAAKYRWVKRASFFLYVAIVPWMSAAYTLFRDRG